MYSPKIRNKMATAIKIVEGKKKGVFNDLLEVTFGSCCSGSGFRNEMVEAGNFHIAGESRARQVPSEVSRKR